MVPRAASGDFTAVEIAVAELPTELLTTRHVSTGTVENIYRDLGAEAAIEG